jgi:hypothetical protein
LIHPWYIAPVSQGHYRREPLRLLCPIETSDTAFLHRVHARALVLRHRPNMHEVRDCRLR